MDRSTYDHPPLPPHVAPYGRNISSGTSNGGVDNSNDHAKAFYIGSIPAKRHTEQISNKPLQDYVQKAAGI